MNNVFITPDNKRYTCIAYAVDAFRSGWEWYGFEDAGDGNYFGFVHGHADEFGYFSAKELRENNIIVYTDPVDILEIQPPIAWRREEEI